MNSLCVVSVLKKREEILGGLAFSTTVLIAEVRARKQVNSRMIFKLKFLFETLENIGHYKGSKSQKPPGE